MVTTPAKKWQVIVDLAGYGNSYLLAGCFKPNRYDPEFGIWIASAICLGSIAATDSKSAIVRATLRIRSCARTRGSIHNALVSVLTSSERCCRSFVLRLQSGAIASGVPESRAPEFGLDPSGFVDDRISF